MKILNVEKKYDNKKLNTVLLNEFNGLTLNIFYKTLRKKDIKVNDIRVSENITVHTGDIIKIFIIDEILFKTKLDFKKLIIYNDDNILVLNKPIGLEVVGTDNSLTYQLSNYLGYAIYPCHRLDRNTSGILLFAKNKESLNILMDKFKKHEINKHYLCVVYGIVTKKHDTLIAYLFKDTKKSLVYISDIPKKGYIKIITEYSVNSINKENNTSTLDVILHTGKTHQIRAHLSHIGYPIIGDGKYGINSINKLFRKKTQMLTSISIEFNFSTDSGILEYLNHKKIYLK